jgi:hypothetical protein
MVRHHIDIEDNNSTIDLQNNNIDLQNNNIDLQNNNIDLQNNNMNLQNNNIENTKTTLQCTKCYKLLSTKYTLSRHEQCCKGIKNPYECQYCHNSYASQQSKSKHEKTCKEKDKPIVSGGNGVTSVTNNTTNNIDLQQNATTINNTTNNNTINMVVFPLADNRLVQFNTDHITMEQLLQAINAARSPPDGLERFTKMIFQNPANHIIKKENKREPHSKVYVGNNKWRIVQDKKIYPKLTDSISSEVAHKIEFDIPDTRLPKQRKKPHLDYYNDIVSTTEPTTRYREAKKIIEYSILNHFEDKKTDAITI